MKRLYKSIQELLPYLPRNARGFLASYIVITCSLALLDIAALGLLAVILTPMIQGKAAHLPFIGEINASGYVWALLVMSGLMILKAILALIIQWLATRKFSDYELSVGDRLFDAYIRAPFSERESRSVAELVRMADVGIANTVGGILLPAISLPQLAVTFLSVIGVLLIAQPMTALAAFLYLLLIAAFMYFGISRAATEAGNVNFRFSLRVAKLMTEMVGALKEITLRNKFDQVAQIVHANRERSTRARANIHFLGTLPQRVVEVALVGGFVIVGGLAYLQGGASTAFAGIALFGLAGFRMIPSIVGFQSVMTSTANCLPNLDAVLADIKTAQRYQEETEHFGTRELEADPQVLSLDKVTFTYPDAPEPAVRDISLDIPIGSSIGIVGTSGSGKSTLVDIILGLLVPQAGELSVDGQSMVDVLGSWRSRVGYVPQEVALFDGSIAQNVALTWSDDIDMDRVNTAIDLAQMRSVVDARPHGIDTVIGERGLALSGGERQRLGIARALYTDPLVLVMDEATSALDTTTEQAVAVAIRELYGKVTVISVAHRLSTIRNNDMVCYMERGQLLAKGTFDEVVAAEPEFAVQAHLAGLI